MFYLGSHFGSVDDGYQGSSKGLKNAFAKRPDDFKRRIVAYYPEDDYAGLLRLEKTWLDMIRKDELGDRYYNQVIRAVGNLGDPETRRKQSQSQKGKRVGYKRTTESIEKQKKTAKERGSYDKTPEWCQMMSEKFKGRKRPGSYASPFSIKVRCEYCDREMGKGGHARWHGENCKAKPTADDAKTL
jgi:hypothetical protein